MRKLLFLPMITALFCAGFSAFGDTVRGGHSIANSMNSSEPTTETTDNAEKTTGAVAARAANRNRAKQVNSATTARVATRTTAARSAQAPTTSTGTVAARAARNVASAKNSGNVVARAGTKQKAVNMGTKVATASENTMVPQECQDSFYGCMDSLCMLDNVSGGRCRCDDRSVELDKVLDQIIKLDAQSKVLAEEGVERLERGKDVDEIYSMADQASDKVLADYKKNNKDLMKGVDGSAKKKSRTLDLSAFNTNLFDTDSFGDNEGGMDILGNDFADKTGNELRDAALKTCATKMPKECSEYGSVLQLVYAQKIKSDCIAYENDLKQQKMNSENLLRTAQKAVRDAAGEAFNRANKYKTVGECAIAYKQCMVGDDVCGPDFSNCIVNKVLVSKSATKMQQIKTGSTIIEIDATTYDSISNKRIMCDAVLDECEKVSSGVWNEFLKMVAPELRSAEFAAEDDQLRNCSKNIIDCIKEAATGEGFQEGTDRWFIFTSDPENVKNICKNQIEQCNAYDSATNSLSSSILQYVTAALSAIRADRCTTSIKNCLEKDTVCHKDYSGCVGVDMDFLWKNCKDIVTPDCAGREDVGYNEYQLKKYVNEVASGVLLNADNKIAEQCRKAVEKAMNEICGSTTSCQSSLMEVAQIDSMFKYAVCPGSESGVLDNITGSCFASAEELSSDDATKSNNWHPLINTLVDPRWISFYENVGTQGEFKSTQNYNENTVATLVKTLNTNFETIYNSITNFESVNACTNGQDAKGFNNERLSKKTERKDGAKVFPNLTANAKKIVAAGVYNSFVSQFYKAKQDYREKAATDAATIATLYAKTKAEKQQACENIGKQYNDTGVKKDDLKVIGATANWLDSAVYDGDRCIINYHYATCTSIYENDNGKYCIYDEGPATQYFNI